MGGGDWLGRELGQGDGFAAGVTGMGGQPDRHQGCLRRSPGLTGALGWGSHIRVNEGPYQLALRYP